MGAHARLSPSSSERWIACPGSVALCESLPEQDDEGSTYSREGTCAHALGEVKASLAFGKITETEYDDRIAEWRSEWSEVLNWPDVNESEMDRHTDAYVDLLRSIAEEMGPGTAVFLERRVYPGIPECDGTADATLVSPTEVRIVDYKYGSGVAVEAVGNSQLRLYGVGAYEECGDLIGTTETISYTVHQPRIGDGHVLTETVTVAEALAWRDSLIPIAEEAIAGSDRFGPSEEACRWCPASGRCMAQMQSVFAEPLDVNPAFLSPEDMSQALTKAPMIAKWLKDLEAVALTVLYKEKKPIPGFKVVMSGGTRGVRDDERAVETLLAEGYTREQFMKPPAEPQVQGIGVLEGLMGKPDFRRLMEDTGIVTKSEGRPSLAPESDKRPSITPNTQAAAVFGDLDD